MSHIEDYFRNNKDALDRLEPTEILWSSIIEEVRKKNKPKRRPRFFLMMAAIAASILIGITIFITIPKVENNYFPLNHSSLTSPEGQLMPLDPTLNKYTLVQFWESGNVLCSEDNCYYYLPAYEKYKDQGFEIYAISLDDDKSEWILGIEENHLPWIHVSDLKGWDSPVCIECNIDKIPASFLLDQKGKIIARDLNAADLDSTLDQLLAQN